MSRVPGTLLIILGVSIIAIGMVGALGEIRDLYRGVTDNAMDEPDVPEEARPDRILTNVGIAAIGLPPLIAGSVLLTRARVRRMHARLRR